MITETSYYYMECAHERQQSCRVAAFLWWEYVCENFKSVQVPGIKCVGSFYIHTQSRQIRNCAGGYFILEFGDILKPWSRRLNHFRSQYNNICPKGTWITSDILRLNIGYTTTSSRSPISHTRSFGYPHYNVCVCVKLKTDVHRTKIHNAEWREWQRGAVAYAHFYCSSAVQDRNNK